MLETDVTTVYGAIHNEQGAIHSELRLVFGNCAERWSYCALISIIAPSCVKKEKTGFSLLEILVINAFAFLNRGSSLN